MKVDIKITECCVQGSRVYQATMIVRFQETTETFFLGAISHAISVSDPEIFRRWHELWRDSVSRFAERNDARAIRISDTN